MLKDFVPRLYQETIFAKCTTKNCLVVLPTGLGKTAIAMMLTAHRLKLYPNSKVVILVPTKPLADQHAESFKKHLLIDEKRIAVFTGDISPDERTKLWQSVQVVFSTPQGLENDVLSNKINLKNVVLLVVDEAHRAVGDYSYVWLAQQYNTQAQFPRILALTASPGSEIEHIAEVTKNLFIETVEIRTPKDSDVAPYVQEVHVQWVKVELTPELVVIQKILNNCVKQRLETLKTLGLNTSGMISKKDLLGFQRELQIKMAEGERDFETLRALSVLAETVKIHHALELLETQAVAPLKNYLEKLMHEGAMAKSKAAKNIAQDINIKTAVIHVQNLYANNIEHPKMKAIARIIEEEFTKDKLRKIIVFTQFRDTAVRIQKELEGITGVVSAVFVGQAKKGLTGLTQKKQAEMLLQFRDGFYNILIATSVGEEGLDIPKVDTVIFYEPVPSAIRQIQRRGRTGRQEKGSVIILMTKNTRDEAYHWAAVRKEKA
ncbi:MAG: helicase-related protein, partial [Candidatus Woesearchaeota archaeon]|nr:helicase-related protein [Candidatus Woesearchaeota archaeon]